MQIDIALKTDRAGVRRAVCDPIAIPRRAIMTRR
jgi:hypothetical protein